MKSDKILIVDDRADIRSLIENILRDQEYEHILSATSGPEALEVVERELPDLILLDLTMPQMDGYQVCEQLQANEETRPIPIIVMSEKRSSQDLQRSFEVGAMDYITKPIDAIELSARTASALKFKRTYDALISAYNEITLLNQHLEELSTTDELTGVKNARCFWDYLSREVQKFTRFQLPLSLIIADLDDFKKINDTYGHLVGDQVLSYSGQLFQQNLRSYDLVARYGGEEFAFLLVNTELAQAAVVAEKIRQMVSEAQIDIGHEKLQCTMSLGVASLTPDTPPENVTAQFLVERADRALYAAKRSGKNRVVLEDAQ